MTGGCEAETLHRYTRQDLPHKRLAAGAGPPQKPQTDRIRNRKLPQALDHRPAAAVGQRLHGRVVGLAEGLVGVRAEEERVLDLTFPADHPDEDVRGKTGKFTVLQFAR